MSELSSLCVQMSVRLFVEVLCMLHVSGAVPCLSVYFADGAMRGPPGAGTD